MNKKRKRIIQIVAMVLLLSMMLSTVAFAMPPGQEKKLLKNEDKYEKEFEFMRNKGIMLGDGFGDYRLNDFVRRGDITVMIVRAFKLNLDKDDTYDKGEFLDLIDKNNYQYNFVKIAKHYNIAKGDGNNFYPDKFVSYDEAFALIERAVKVANSNVTVLVEDEEDVIKLRDWYKEKFTKEDSFRNFLIEMLFDELSKTEIKQKLGEPATRGDIASMLYYVLIGDKEFYVEDDKNEIEGIVIELELDELDEFIEFDDLDFKEAFKNIENHESKDVEYIKFTNIKELNKLKVGTLYYNYVNERKNSLVSEEFMYYIDGNEDDEREVSKIAFDPNEVYNKTVFIEYNAYIEHHDKGVVKEIVKYPGVIKINFPIFEIDDIEIDGYKYYDDDNNVIYFANELKDVAQSIYEEIDYVNFEIPNENEGILSIKYKNNTKFDDLGEEDEKNDYILNRIKGLKFKPDTHYDFNDGDEITISYTAFNRTIGKPTTEYYGRIIIELEKED